MTQNLHQKAEPTLIALQNAPIDSIEVSVYQVRKQFDFLEIQSLSESIKNHGVLQPILVIVEGNGYKLIAGERRLRAAKKAGLKRVPVKVVPNKASLLQEIALRENLDRVDLHPIEEGYGYNSLIKSGTYYTHEDIAKAFGKSKSRVTECICFSKLPHKTINKLIENNIKSRSILRHLLNLSEEEHIPFIQEMMKKEQKIPNKFELEKKEIVNKPIVFTYKIGDHGFSVSGFKWENSQNKEILKDYIKSLQDILEELKKL